MSTTNLTGTNIHLESLKIFNIPQYTHARMVFIYCQCFVSVNSCMKLCHEMKHWMRCKDLLIAASFSMLLKSFEYVRSIIHLFCLHLGSTPFSSKFGSHWQSITLCSSWPSSGEFWESAHGMCFGHKLCCILSFPCSIRWHIRIQRCSTAESMELEAM